MFNFKTYLIHSESKDFLSQCSFLLRSHLFGRTSLQKIHLKGPILSKNLIILSRILLDLKTVKLHSNKSSSLWKTLHILNKSVREWGKELFFMVHLEPVKPLLPKHVQDKQMFLFIHVMQHSFVKCMLVWEQRKFDNCLKKHDKVLLPSFTLMKLMRWETEAVEC